MGDPEHSYVWLQYDRELSDFDLRLKFRACRESKGNSEIHIRSRYDTSKDVPHGRWLNGVQVRDFDGCGILDDEGHQALKVVSGFIAFRVHMNNELKIHFRDLFLKELPG